MMNDEPARGNGRKRRVGTRLNHTEGSPSKMRGCLVGEDRKIKDYRKYPQRGGTASRTLSAVLKSANALQWPQSALP